MRVTQPHRIPKRDLTGMVFGRLTIIAFAGRNSRSMRFWFCRCDCGTEKMVAHESVISGSSQSCGCRHRAMVKASFTTHNSSGTRAYTTWSLIKGRCTNPRLGCYPSYGGRGINVCARWFSSFENFLADMGDRPEGMTLDRIDNNGNYEPGNCRWATRKQQQRNRRNTVFLEFRGQRKAIDDWADCLGLPRDTIRSRLRRNWPVDMALTVPRFQLNGKYRRKPKCTHCTTE